MMNGRNPEARHSHYPPSSHLHFKKKLSTSFHTERNRNFRAISICLENSGIKSMGMPTYAYTTKKAIKSGTGGGSDQGEVWFVG